MELDNSVDVLLSHSVSSTTKLAYKTGFQTFLSYVLLQGIMYTSSKLPTLTEELLLSFVAHCFHKLKLRYSTIKLYLCGIRYNYLVQTNDTVFQTSSLPRLQAALTGVKRLQGTPSISKKPITAQVLQKLIHRLRIGFVDPYTDLMLTAVFNTAFYGFLRSAEFTVKYDYNEHTNLSLGDLDIFSDHVILTLKQSKTDPFRKSVAIALYATSNDICPRSALLSYLKLRNSRFPLLNKASDPLYLMFNGQALTRAYFIEKLKDIIVAVGLNDKNYSGHSLRRGAASTCGSARVPDYMIQTLGRWKSNCHLRYIDIPDSAVRDTQIAMGRQTGL